MNRPFRSLTCLELAFKAETAPVDLDLFLGGSARVLSLDGIPVLGLRKHLWSAALLVRLELCGVPHSGYSSPRGMVACLSVLTSRKSHDRLRISLKSPWPESPTSASTNTYSTRSHRVAVQRDHQILGGPCGPDQFHKLEVADGSCHPPADIRSSITFPIHRRHTEVQDRRRSFCRRL